MKRKPQPRPTLKDKLDARAAKIQSAEREALLKRAREKFILGQPLSYDERWVTGFSSNAFLFQRAVFGFWFPKFTARRRTVAIMVAALDQPA